MPWGVPFRLSGECLYLSCSTWVPRCHLPPASFTSIWSLSCRAPAKKGFPSRVLLVLRRAPRESMVTLLWFSRDLGTQSPPGTGDTFPGWLRPPFLSTLSRSSPKRVHEIPNRAAGSAASRAGKHLRARALCLLPCLHSTAGCQGFAEAGL